MRWAIIRTVLSSHSIYDRLLSDENTRTCTLENLVGIYHRHFSRQDSFRVGSALTLLLKMRDLLPTSAQRIAALALLHELYRSDSYSSNPFNLFFAEMLQPTVEEGHSQVGVVTMERWFLAQILSPAFPREVCVCTCAWCVCCTVFDYSPTHAYVCMLICMSFLLSLFGPYQQKAGHCVTFQKKKERIFQKKRKGCSVMQMTFYQST